MKPSFDPLSLLGSCLMGMIITLLMPACVQVKTDPIKIEPIYIEITINHRVQKELDDVFASIDKASETADYIPVEPTK